MNCECCGTILTTQLRITEFAPYLKNCVALCDACFDSKRIPYNDMINFVSLYGDNIETIPSEKITVILQELKGIGEKKNMTTRAVFMQFVDDLRERALSLQGE